MNILEKGLIKMLNYLETVKQLKEKDEYAITKLAIYYELSSVSSAKNLSNEDIGEIVDYLHDIYFSNDDLNYLYPKLVEAALNVFDYDLNALLSSIRENQDGLEEPILDEMDLL